MKIKMRFLLLFSVILALVIAPGILFGQTVDTTGISEPLFPGETATVSGLLNIYNAIFGALVILWGYLAPLIGIKKEPKTFIFVVLAGAIALGLAFVLLGFSKVFPLVFSFLGAIGVYDIFLKPAGLTLKKQVPAVTAKE